MELTAGFNVKNRLDLVAFVGLMGTAADRVFT